MIVKLFNSVLMLINDCMFYVILVIWIMVIFCFLFGFIFSEYDEKFGRCLDFWIFEKVGMFRWIVILYFFVFVLFFGVLFYCYV